MRPSSVGSSHCSNCVRASAILGTCSALTLQRVGRSLMACFLIYNKIENMLVVIFQSVRYCFIIKLLHEGFYGMCEHFISKSFGTYVSSD